MLAGICLKPPLLFEEAVGLEEVASSEIFLQYRHPQLSMLPFRLGHQRTAGTAALQGSADKDQQQLPGRADKGKTIWPVPIARAVNPSCPKILAPVSHLACLLCPIGLGKRGVGVPEGVQPDTQQSFGIAMYHWSNHCCTVSKHLHAILVSCAGSSYPLKIALLLK